MSLEKNLKILQEYEESIAYSLTHSVMVGLPKEKVGSKVYGDGVSVIDVGIWNEYGVPEENIPERSWLRASFGQNKKEVNKFIDKQYKAIFNGRPAKQAFGFMGVFAQSLVQKAFTNKGYGRWPANAPSTIKRKGSSQPLIDTGILRNSVTWVIR